ncbi:prepilin-type N-terminal cleavage/methylation domain-containing protein [Thiorhodococcus mannitoliphagus]|uniref:Type II secretion system protein H n=1 Tax=Thiorhodococcus mannitoliphagus TaxID=329406 RepID=A0A6P1DXT6_9GAMM|nr:GspH/FimT family pseudopilin [Thiorhodococcus mannitoliphagus]NEX21536.1 prepilin-type N-terminal cleavage/methylation domain-containing protein [Thiorhodococcus mannitoliphagus]
MPWVKSSNGQRGLTLLELILVVAILAILIGVAVPSMHEMLARNRLKAAAQAIAEDLQWARSEAIKRNRSIAVSLEPSTWCYGITLATALGCDCRQTQSAPKGCELKRVNGVDYPGTSLSATFPQTVFEPRRATARNGSLLLQSDRGTAIKVILSRLGRVRLCTPNGTLPGYEDC